MFDFNKLSSKAKFKLAKKVLNLSKDESTMLDNLAITVSEDPLLSLLLGDEVTNFDDLVGSVMSGGTGVMADTAQAKALVAKALSSQKVRQAVAGSIMKQTYARLVPSDRSLFAGLLERVSDLPVFEDEYESEIHFVSEGLFPKLSNYLTPAQDEPLLVHSNHLVRCPYCAEAFIP